MVPHRLQRVVGCSEGKKYVSRYNPNNPMIFSHPVGRKCRYNREVSCVWKNTRMSNYRANGAKSLPTSSQKFRTISEFAAPKYLLRTSWSWYNLSLEAVPMSSG